MIQYLGICCCRKGIVQTATAVIAAASGTAGAAGGDSGTVRFLLLGS